MENWKEIFKPNCMNVVLALLLAYLFVPLINYDTGIRCIRALCPSGWMSLAGYHIGLIGSSTVFSEHYEYMVVGLIPSYVLSSILVYFIISKNKMIKEFKKN